MEIPEEYIKMLEDYKNSKSPKQWYPGESEQPPLWCQALLVLGIIAAGGAFFVLMLS